MKNTHKYTHRNTLIISYNNNKTKKNDRHKYYAEYFSMKEKQVSIEYKQGQQSKKNNNKGIKKKKIKQKLRV